MFSKKEYDITKNRQNSKEKNKKNKETNMEVNMTITEGEEDKN